MEGGVDKHAWEKQGTRLTLICMGCLPLFHVFLHHSAAASAAPHPTKDMDIEQDKTLTFHHHLSSPLLFSHPRSSFFWHCAGVPQSCSTLTVCEGKCDKLEARPCSEKEQSEVERGISAIGNVQPSWGWKCLGHVCSNPRHLPAWQLLNAPLLHPHTPPFTRCS